MTPSQQFAAAASLPAIQWDDWSTRFLFFPGKGGVGKTTVASTIALRLAESGRQVLLVSTDPASNLDDVFELNAGPEPTAVPGVPRLALMNLDPEAAALAYRERVVGPYRGVLPSAAIRSMEEQLSGACTVEIAAFNEFTGLLTDPELLGRFDTVIFDTAPTGHTLRLLSLPKAWSGFIETSSQGASCLGPLAGLEAQHDRYAATVKALADSTLTTLVLVSRPDVGALREATRAGSELRALGIHNQRLIVNGVLDAPDGDRVAEAMARVQQAALRSLPPSLRDVPLVAVPLVPSGLTGLGALRQLSVGGWTTAAVVDPERPTDLPGLERLVEDLANTGQGVVMTMGKGGVGKTSLAVALAVALSRAGHPVHLSTTDPAADLLQVLGTDRPEGLTVSAIDPATETSRYAEDVLAAAGELDPEGRALLEEDLRSPCTEEIAVFRAFARTVDQAGGGFVVLDTAPTGHTLLLLDAAESYHREVARTAGEIPAAVRALLPRLRDPEYTRMLLVTLAQTTPVLEAERLQADLRRAGIEPYGWIINASLAASGTRHPVLARRAALEQPQIRRVADELAARCWLVPWRASRESTSTIEGTGRAVSLTHAIDLEPSHG